MPSAKQVAFGVFDSMKTYLRARDMSIKQGNALGNSGKRGSADPGSNGLDRKIGGPRKAPKGFYESKTGVSYVASLVVLFV